MNAHAHWLWMVLGFGGQSMFAARFLVQWLASEKRGRSVVPVAFWYLSLAGGVVLLLYALHRRDPVFIAGQSLGLFVYSRNLMLLRDARTAGPPASAAQRPEDP